MKLPNQLMRIAITILLCAALTAQAGKKKHKNTPTSNTPSASRAPSSHTNASTSATTIEQLKAAALNAAQAAQKALDEAEEYEKKGRGNPAYFVHNKAAYMAAVEVAQSKAVAAAKAREAYTAAVHNKAAYAAAFNVNVPIKGDFTAMAASAATKTQQELPQGQHSLFVQDQHADRADYELTEIDRTLAIVDEDEDASSDTPIATFRERVTATLFRNDDIGEEVVCGELCGMLQLKNDGSAIFVGMPTVSAPENNVDSKSAEEVPTSDNDDDSEHDLTETDAAIERNLNDIIDDIELPLCDAHAKKKPENFLHGFLTDPKRYVANDEDVTAKVLMLLEKTSGTAIDVMDVRNYLKTQQKVLGTIGSKTSQPKTDEMIENYAADFADGYESNWKNLNQTEKYECLIGLQLTDEAQTYHHQSAQQSLGWNNDCPRSGEDVINKWGW